MYPTLFIRPTNCRGMTGHGHHDYHHQAGHHHHHHQAGHHHHNDAPSVGIQGSLPVARGNFMGVALCLGMFGFFFLFSGGIMMGVDFALFPAGTVIFVLGIIMAISCVVICIRGRRQQQNMAIVNQQTGGITTLGYGQPGTQSAIVQPPPPPGATIVYGPGAGDGYQGQHVHQGQPHAYQLQSQQYPQGPPQQYQQAGTPYPPQASYPPQPDSQASQPPTPPPAYEDAVKQQVESSFNTMGDILDSKSGRMNTSPFDSIQTVKYWLAAKGKSATSAFTPSHQLTKNMQSAAASYKAQQKAEKEKREQACLMPKTTEKRVTKVAHKRKAADEATAASSEKKSRQKALEDLVERRQRKL